MRIARAAHPGGIGYGVVEGDRLTLLDDPHTLPADRHAVNPGRTSLRLRDVRLLAPVEPRTVVGMAHNTGSADRDLPPQAFLKPARSVVGPHEAIPLPAAIGRVDVEGELGVVIGRPARHLRPVDALDAVLGYTVANDVTARDLQQVDPLWTTAKGYDGFTPLGPWIEIDLDPSDAIVRMHVNGSPLAPGSTARLARDVTEILVYLTSFMTLGPGDVVLTGAPGEYAAIHPGDQVTVTVDGIGSLHNAATQLTGAPV
ncbi:MAG: fumarylacetoacetate hydrolase family protein [Micromonospora sp.]